MTKAVLLLSSLIYLLSCSGISNPEQEGNQIKAAGKERQVAISDTLLIKWRQDSLGCLKYRSYETAQQLKVKYQLEKKAITDLVKLLGEPNRIIITDSKRKVYRYFYDTCCKNGVLDKECDYSWIDFNYESNISDSCFITAGKM